MKYVLVKSIGHPSKLRLFIKFLMGYISAVIVFSSISSLFFKLHFFILRCNECECVWKTSPFSYKQKYLDISFFWSNLKRGIQICHSLHTILYMFLFLCPNFNSNVLLTCFLCVHVTLHRRIN